MCARAFELTIPINHPFFSTGRRLIFLVNMSLAVSLMSISASTVIRDFDITFLTLVVREVLS